MDKTPVISVLTVSYNSGEFIRETIESVLGQKYENFEFIICDDNSKDNTWAIIGSYDDVRIRAFLNEKNLGEYQNRNRAVQLARGQYLIFIDGDDVMYPHALETFLFYALQFPECGFLIARDWDFRIKCPLKLSPVDFYRFEFFDGTIMGNFTKLFFKTSVIQAQAFPERVKTGDSYMQLKLAQKHPVLIVPDGLTWWRRRSGNATLSLFKNERYHAESTRYRLEMLEVDCPLDQRETETARQSIYGIYLRLIFWLTVRGKLGDAFYLAKAVKVPNKYWSAFFKPRLPKFYSNATGDIPLHTKR